MRPAYTYQAKGRYWYFRKDGYQEPLPGSPGEPEFTERYNALLERGHLKRARLEKRASAARARRLTAVAASKAGMIYFIGASVGPVKIGFTTDLESRLQRLQMNSPARLKVLASYEGHRRDEIELHRQFADARLHGEWFRRSAKIMAAIREAEGLRNSESDASEERNESRPLRTGRGQDCELFSHAS